MLGTLLWLSASIWALILTQLLLVRWLAPDLRRVESKPRECWPRVSIVVPARNEEDGIEAAVRSFCSQDYPELEVIVVDDGSTDGTSEILARLERECDCLTVVSGSELPPGWMGKVWALEQGQRRASGDWLLFVDADVIYHSQLVRRAIATADAQQCTMMVTGPKFITASAVEAAVMSQLYIVGLGLVPAWLISRTRSRYLASGAGVFNLVRRDALEDSGAFASLRSAVVDDVILGIKVKAAGHRIVIVAAGDMVQVRMYDGVADTVRGFTKNVAPVLGRPSVLLLPPLLALGFGLSLLPYIALLIGIDSPSILLPAITALVLMHAVHGVVVNYVLLPWQVTFLSPVRELVWWWIIVRSVLFHRRHGLHWRGRVYKEPNLPQQ